VVLSFLMSHHEAAAIESLFPIVVIPKPVAQAVLVWW